MEDRTESMETKDRQGTPSETSKTEQRTSWISVVSGWLAALGASLVVGGILGGEILLGGEPAADAKTSEIARLMVTLMVAFLFGGYVAGRMAGRLGLKYGLLVALLSVLTTAALIVAGLVAGVSLAAGLVGVTLPERPDVRQSLEAALSPSGLLVVLLPFVGGAFGRAWGGAKTGGKRP